MKKTLKYSSNNESTTIYKRQKIKKIMWVKCG